MMGEEEEVRIIDDDTVAEWEAGLPSLHDLTPLSHCLIPAELASAFKISPEPTKTLLDVNHASQTTLSSLRGGGGGGANFKPFLDDDHVMSELEPEPEPAEEGSDSKKTRRTEPADDLPLDDQSAAGAGAGANSKTSLKRPRLVWTPQLHKRFVDVVAHLGLKNAVPKTIMQLMNVEGLTRENVASHLQKYRLYVKRMQGLSNDGPSPSDHLFASTPVPLKSFNDSSSNHGNGNGNGSHSTNGNLGLPPPPISLPYPPPPPPPPPQQQLIQGFTSSSSLIICSSTSHHHSSLLVNLRGHSTVEVLLGI